MLALRAARRSGRCSPLRVAGHRRGRSDLPAVVSFKETRAHGTSGAEERRHAFAVLGVPAPSDDTRAAYTAYAALSRNWPPVEPSVQHAFEVVSGVLPPASPVPSSVQVKTSTPPGTSVRVVGGPYAGREGILKKVMRRQAKVTLDNNNMKDAHLIWHAHLQETRKTCAGAVVYPSDVLEVWMPHPNPGYSDSNWISDGLNELTSLQQWNINNMIEFTKQETGAEIAICLIEDIRGSAYGSR
jgi:hypothetical protein